MLGQRLLAVLVLCGGSAVLAGEATEPTPAPVATVRGASAPSAPNAPNALNADADPVAASSARLPSPLREIGRGIASWYGGHFHGRKTASGEPYDMHALTAAHPSLPFGTVVRVRSLVNGKEVDVRINDRGPHVGRRLIDLSRGAAEALGLIETGSGTKPVALSLLPRGTVLTPPKEVIRLEGSRRRWGDARAAEPPGD